MKTIIKEVQFICVIIILVTIVIPVLTEYKTIREGLIWEAKLDHEKKRGCLRRIHSMCQIIWHIQLENHSTLELAALYS